MKLLLTAGVISILCILCITGCDKNEINYGDYTKISSDQALLKINYNIAYRANPGVQIKINGERVSGLITSRYPYPGGGYNTVGDSRPDYLAVNTGNVTVSISIPQKGTNIDSVELFKANMVTEAGKSYTLHVTDTAMNTKSLVTNDDFALPDSGYTKYRFVNLMPNVQSLDLYYGDSLLCANIAYLKASEYIIKQVKPSAAWSVRASGLPSNSPVIATYTSGSVIGNRKSYTVFATGYRGLTDAVRKPYLAFFLIR